MIVPLTPRQREVLRAIAVTGSGVAAARTLGITYQTLRNHLNEAYSRLGVDGIIPALRAVGWLVVPEETE